MGTGLIAIVYAPIYYLLVTDGPKGSTYFKPKKAGAMEVTSPRDFVLYCVMQAPIVLALALLAWKLGSGGLHLISQTAEWAAYAGLAAFYALQLADT